MSSCGGGDTCAGGELKRASSEFVFSPGLTTCKKCKLALATVCLRLKDAYCDDCFYTAAIHKFRANLGKNKLARSGEKVLLAYDGSVAAGSLLAMLGESDCGSGGNSASVSQGKRLFLTADVIVVDDWTPFTDSESNRTSAIEALVASAASYGHQVHVVTLEHVFDGLMPLQRMEKEAENFYYNLPDQEITEKLVTLFKETLEITAKESLLRQLRRKALVRAARLMNVTKEFTTETVSIQIL